MSAEKTYEMLWDCGFCGGEKWLGLTHRHCPGCGAPQDPDTRYFPDDADRVAVEDHEFVGADQRCSACDAPASARAAHCAGCGFALAGNAALATVLATAPAASVAASRRSGPWIAVGSLVALSALGFGLVRFWTHDIELDVVGHHWQRQIEIQRLEAGAEEQWCDRMPADAYSVDRRREVRSHRKVADGQSCSEVKTDLGDGTYRSTQHCETRYRKEPVYADICRYRVDRWRTQRQETTSAESVDVEPHWPAVQLAQVGDCLGCEREGTRTESYVMRLAAGELSADCELDQSTWQRARRGDRFRARAGGVFSDVQCGSLSPVP
jgi:hypothetical protein